jgi:predicted HAD superfamily Cof-like phosphohydrolase
MSDLQDRVRTFHEKFGFHVGDDPMVPPPDQIRFERAGLVAEEAGELVAELMAGLSDTMVQEVLGRFVRKAGAAFSDRLDGSREFDLLKVMREAADLHYGVLGAAVNCGFDLDRATAEVHEANMTRSGPDERGMAYKGPGFQAPDMSRALSPRSHLDPDLFIGLSTRPRNSLLRGGVRTAQKLVDADPVHLLQFRGLGVHSLHEIRVWLGSLGYDLWWFSVLDGCPRASREELCSLLSQESRLRWENAQEAGEGST